MIVYVWVHHPQDLYRDVLGLVCLSQNAGLFLTDCLQIAATSVADLNWLIIVDTLVLLFSCFVLKIRSLFLLLLFFDLSFFLTLQPSIPSQQVRYLLILLRNRREKFL